MVADSHLYALNLFAVFVTFSHLNEVSDLLANLARSSVFFGMPLLEVCIDSIHGAMAAQAGGAQRVELCSALIEGGVTPSGGLINACRKAYNGKLMVMIRPRGGDFVYTDEELLVMLEDIRIAKASHADGVVFGCLRTNGCIDSNATSRLWQLAKDLDLDATFHRAFDMTTDPLQALDEVIRLSVPRVLTSGCAPTAIQGAATLAALVQRSAGRIVVMAGSGVTPSNTPALVAATGVTELHSSAKRCHRSPMVYRRPGMTMASSQPPSDYEWNITDEQIVRQFRMLYSDNV